MQVCSPLWMIVDCLNLFPFDVFCLQSHTILLHGLLGLRDYHGHFRLEGGRGAK